MEKKCYMSRLALVNLQLCLDRIATRQAGDTGDTGCQLISYYFFKKTRADLKIAFP